MVQRLHSAFCILNWHADVQRQFSVGYWLFDAIDHDDVDRTSLRVELEPELFLQRREERWRVRDRPAADRR